MSALSGAGYAGSACPEWCLAQCEYVVRPMCAQHTAEIFTKKKKISEKCWNCLILESLLEHIKKYSFNSQLN